MPTEELRQAYSFPNKPTLNDALSVFSVTDYLNTYGDIGSFYSAYGPVGLIDLPDADEVPVEETLGALGDLVTEGKIRHVGLSNETAWGVSQFLAASKTGLPRVASIQNAYNLIDPSHDNELWSHTEAEDNHKRRRDTDNGNGLRCDKSGI